LTQSYYFFEEEVNAMKHLSGPGLFILVVSMMFMVSFVPAENLSALELNEDGRSLIQQATQAYNSDMDNRPTVTDELIIGYAGKIARGLVPKGKRTPEGVTIRVTVIESPLPELYAYVDGHLVMTTGMLFAMDNEAQLAGVLSHEIVQLVEGYYISMYQEIKKAEKRGRRRAAAGALFGGLLDVAVDYAVEREEIRQTDQYLEGEATYRETMENMAAIGAAHGAYYSIKDVIESVPSKDNSGNWIDPRLQFEPVADAQGMEYLALAGYDASEAAEGWKNAHLVNSEMARTQEQAMGMWASQLREMQVLMELNMNRIRQSLGASGLVQTLSGTSPTRSQFVAELTNLKEVRDAQKIHGRKKRKTEYLSFLQKVLLPRAEEALEKETYEKANNDYRTLYKKGVKTGQVVYGLAKSGLGDFAFAASEAEKKEAEDLYREAAKLDPNYALPYRGLGELYDDWERYDDAVQAYRRYLELSPKSRDREQIERKITVLERKASR
jgi:predicted Zn-dependent protease